MPSQSPMIFDHIGFSVADYAVAKTFYAAALAPLGITLVMEIPASVTGDVDVAGFGRAGQPTFWINPGDRTQPHLHIAFTAETRAEVDAFYKAAIAAGGRDNGGPGLRAEYHPSYYAAFVLDADGHNIEALCHKTA